MNAKNTLLHRLPAVDRLLNEPALRDQAGDIPHVLLVEAAKHTVAELRREVLAGESPDQRWPRLLGQVGGGDTVESLHGHAASWMAGPA